MMCINDFQELRAQKTREIKIIKYDSFSPNLLIISFIQSL